MVTLTATGPGTNFSWDFGDNSIVDIGVNVSHYYESAGTFKVKCTITASGQTRVVAKSIQIPPKATKVKIIQLDLHQFSNWSGTGYDPRPSIYFEINQQGSSTVLFTSFTSHNIPPSIVINYPVSLEITDFTKMLEFKFYNANYSVQTGLVTLDLDQFRSGGAGSYPGEFDIGQNQYYFYLHTEWLK